MPDTDEPRRAAALQLALAFAESGTAPPDDQEALDQMLDDLVMEDDGDDAEDLTDPDGTADLDEPDAPAEVDDV